MRLAQHAMHLRYELSYLVKALAGDFSSGSARATVLAAEALERINTICAQCYDGSYSELTVVSNMMDAVPQTEERK